MTLFPSPREVEHFSALLPRGGTVLAAGPVPGALKRAVRRQQGQLTLLDAPQGRQLLGADQVIARQGLPDLLSVHYRNEEDEILAALSRAVKTVRLRFTPEDPEVALRAVLRLERLGRYLHNFSLDETHRLVLRGPWWTRQELLEYLQEIPPEGPRGYIYARLTPGEGLPGQENR
ncbi:hypothetical protein AU468_00760 [Alkalispirochaeta sphaeroplastigenens]|uniref:Uncharacterized protein n=1 Tax=Alkalispirochaeta sphaeroplastigenens TaxID=1187066 RepID=A0A2S4K101_9SPIO|nr:hypothetical protein [Alkalispirochaeta sphaeroplastigenens]POR05438.1 hypothetical protein AU468_00760 [Alkalispirochaeta sphaeroplastigenens]